MAVEHPRTSRENSLDFLRLFAASVVVLAHAQADFHTSFLWNASQLFDGVGMFFIMSGMLVYRSGESTWTRTGRWRDFFWNRYLRVAPGIYAFAVIAPLVLVAAGAVTLANLFKFPLVVWLGSSLVLLPNYDPPTWQHVGTGVINGQLYTIPAEVSFYLIVPVLVLAARRFGFPRMLAGFVLVSIVISIGAVLGGHTSEAVVHHTFVERAGFFAAGIFWARYRERVPARWWLFVVACAIYLPVKLIALDTDVLGPLSPFLIAIPLSYMVVFFGYHGPRAIGHLTERVGDLSYSTYIWHVLVINLLLFLGLAGEWWLVPLTLAITWCVAWLSWRLVEKPALRLKRISSRNLTRVPG
ncbi:acyltransferase [Curtobacterium sp. MCPF17_047]|uniref:acyltransferase family protein n=1 Tax=Curtobacterium sp. MCPF17_047 TaxID=2175654 RepID=UPI0015E89460|nr:acyltransferase [Curtobacterium sp. MCPF17_047]